MKVSICMITYNHANYIIDSIEGILIQQTNFPFELVIGEDFSKDATRSICEQYEKKYPGKVRLLPNDGNLGMMKNFIRTLRACDGEYVALCEGDDYWTDPNKLQHQVDFLENNPAYSICTHNATILAKQDSAFNDKKYVHHGMPELISFSQVLTGNSFPTPSILYRNLITETDLEIIGQFPVGDWVLQLVLLKKGDMHYENVCRTTYRLHESGAFSALNAVEKNKILVETKQKIAKLLCSNFKERFIIYKSILNIYINKLKSDFRSHSYSPSNSIHFLKFIFPGNKEKMKMLFHSIFKRN